MKLLYVLGGMFVGDTFHCIPYLNKFTSEGYDITWVTGTYSKDASQLIASQKNLRISNLVYLDDTNPRPISLDSRARFCDKFKAIRHRLNLGNFDKEIYDVEASFDRDYNNKPEIAKFVDFEWDIKKTNGDYICCQYSTMHAYKEVPTIATVKYPLLVKSLGKLGEHILPRSEDCRGMSMSDVLKLIMGCKFFIGIHSALSVLSFYCGKPTILVFFSGAGIHFSNFKSNCIDVLQPTTENLQAAVDEMMRRESSG